MHTMSYSILNCMSQLLNPKVSTSLSMFSFFYWKLSNKRKCINCINGEPFCQILAGQAQWIITPPIVKDHIADFNEWLPDVESWGLNELAESTIEFRTYNSVHGVFAFRKKLEIDTVRGLIPCHRIWILRKISQKSFNHDLVERIT